MQYEAGFLKLQDLTFLTVFLPETHIETAPVNNRRAG
jgi:hypothetical protein